MKNPWLWVAILILILAGLFTIEPDNRWWWFLLGIPAFIAAWLASDQIRKHS